MGEFAMAVKNQRGRRVLEQRWMFIKTKTKQCRRGEPIDWEKREPCQGGGRRRRRLDRQSVRQNLRQRCEK